MLSALLAYKFPKGRPKTLNTHEYMIVAEDKNEIFSSKPVESHYQIPVLIYQLIMWCGKESILHVSLFSDLYNGQGNKVEF